MPRFDFTCRSCGGQQERILTLREREQLQLCTCGGVLEQGWNGIAPGVAFKGTGWTPKHYNKPGRRR